MESQVMTLHVIDDDDKQKELWDLYDDAFKELNLNSPCRQSLHYNEFTSALRDDRVIKLVLCDIEGKYVGISLVTNFLELIPWLSLSYFENNFPLHFTQRTIFYFLGTAVNEEYQLKKGGIRIFNAIGDLLPIDCIVGYDYTENSEKAMARLGSMIAHKLQGEGKIFDKQTYWLGKRGGF